MQPLTIEIDAQNMVQPHPKKETIGYITDLDVGVFSLNRDLVLHSPFSSTAPVYQPLGAPGGIVTVAAILGKVFWKGDHEAPIAFTAYVSKDNAAKVRWFAALNTNARDVRAFGFWCASCDRGESWFEQFFPLAPTRPGGVLDRNTVATEPANAMGAAPYKVHFEISPPTNAVTLQYSSGAAARNVTLWGGA